MRRLLLWLQVDTPLAASRPPPRYMGKESAGYPAEELLDADPVHAAHDRVVAHPQHRDLLAVQLLPLALRRGVAVHQTEAELDAQVAQQLSHRLRFTALVRAVKDRFAVTHRHQW